MVYQKLFCSISLPSEKRYFKKQRDVRGCYEEETSCGVRLCCSFEVFEGMVTPRLQSPARTHVNLVLVIKTCVSARPVKYGNATGPYAQTNMLVNNGDTQLDESV